MIYLFYGPDNFSIRKKLDSWRERFKKIDQSGINLIELDGQNLSFVELENSVLAPPFLSKSRLVIVKNLLVANKDKLLKEKIGKLLQAIPSSTILLFVEFGQPDKRESLFKKLNSEGRSNFFPAPTPEAINRFIGQKLSQNDVTLPRELRSELTGSLGSDLWRIDNELEKLILFYKSNGNKISALEMEKLLIFESDPNIFHFIESLAEKNLHRATNLLVNLTNKSGNELYLLSMIIYQYRTMLIVNSLVQKKITRDQMAKKSGLHPFVIQKNLALLNNYTTKQLYSTYRQLYSTDFNIKTGKVEASLGLVKLINSLSTVL